MKSGNDRIRSTRSSGMSGILEAVKGDGRTGLVGFVSMLKERISDRESGIGTPWPLVAVAPLWRRISATQSYRLYMKHSVDCCAARLLAHWRARLDAQSTQVYKAFKTARPRSLTISEVIVRSNSVRLWGAVRRAFDELSFNATIGSCASLLSCADRDNLLYVMLRTVRTHCVSVAKPPNLQKVQGNCEGWCYRIEVEFEPSNVATALPTN